MKAWNESEGLRGPDGPLERQPRGKTAVFGWLAFVVASVFLSQFIGDDPTSTRTRPTSASRSRPTASSTRPASS